MSIQFTANGHKNILARHPTTLEFTKDKELSLHGDCILGISATYDLETIRKAHLATIKIRLEIDGIFDELIAKYNPSFSDSHEMVIRKTDFADTRTFAISANKSAKDINKELVEKMKKPSAILVINIFNIL